jgi:hypothetical protein
MASKGSTLRERLERELERVSRIALRDPRTWPEVANRARWDRLKNILWRRYEK